MVREKFATGAVDLLKAHLGAEIRVTKDGTALRFSAHYRSATFTLLLPGEQSPPEVCENILPADYIFSSPGKVAAMVRGRLELNKKVFARNCQVMQVPKQTAVAFIDEHHLMKSTSSAMNLGLYDDKGNLLCVASFSKGRKMRRLEENERSYELIRFCCCAGITVSGGLSKLLVAFCRRKKAAEIMTYVDRQFSDGASFVSAGFRINGHTPPMRFVVDQSFGRTGISESDPFHPCQVWNCGNIKMLYRCR